MPLTKEELQKNEFYQKLKEQDRSRYLNELEQKRKLSGGVIVTENGQKIIGEDVQPLRNDSGIFIAVEDPFDEGNNLQDPDQILTADLKTTVYLTDPYWNNVLDREFSEL
tara:strand:+ start:1845 stop:2174 length:330 start_codon:yes stop_codon:yes gene_type:complete